MRREGSEAGGGGGESEVGGGGRRELLWRYIDVNFMYLPLGHKFHTETPSFQVVLSYHLWKYQVVNKIATQ